MSRRKQSNPKPLLKSECQETTDEMTVERDNKDFGSSDMNEETSVADMNTSNPYTEERLHESSLSPKSVDNLEIVDKQSPDRSPDTSQDSLLPKVRLNISLASDPALKPDAKDLKIIKNDAGVEELRKKDTEDDALPHGHIKSPTSDLPQRMKGFMCHPCGIGFSSLSTLEAHQTYYCSHRKDTDEEAPSNSLTVTENLTSGEPSLKAIKTGKQYACTQCSYSADKKVSLNRHMRMHQSSPTPSSNISNGDDSSSQQVDRYCSECDIRFSNVKTYRAHKQHYCSSRRTDGPCTPKAVDMKKSGSVSPQQRSKTPTPASPPQPFLALPTNPILIIPYSLVRTASLLPGPLTSVTAGISNPDTTCFAFENGALQPLAVAVTSQGTSDTVRSKTPATCNATMTALLTEKNSRAVHTELLKNSKKDGTNRESTPLDLSLRRSPILQNRNEPKLDIEAMLEAKENLLIASGKITPEQIVCAPSLPNSPSLSPSPRKKTSSPRVGNIPLSPNPIVSEQSSLRSLVGTDHPMKLNESNIIAPLLSKHNIELAMKLSSASGNKSNDNLNSISSPLLNLATNLPMSIVPPTSNIQPQIYVKQGVSKCKECNIVFCKYENYLAHKQHYCSARNQEDIETKINTSPTLGSQSESVLPPVSYHQLICAACGIKYTSLDNLRAHQSFYCPKGGDLPSQVPVGKEKCSKCKIVHDIGQQCPIIQGSFKCPVCDVISLSTAESRKHLETHGSVKAFRCSICRYKGNTLRGMRTHIRMHFDKKTSDFNEENYMSCILEEDGTEIQSSGTITPDQHLQQQLFNCEICNYSSSYKGNVMRHMKLVHPQSSVPTSVTPETELQEDTDDSIQNGNGNQIKCDESVAVKTEPVDAKYSDKDSIIENALEVKPEPEENSTIDATVSCTSPLTSDENLCPLKYCQNCDIKFKYMNSYIAHKQFYCKSNRDDSETSSLAPVKSPTMVNKNKENLETVL